VCRKLYKQTGVKNADVDGDYDDNDDDDNNNNKIITLRTRSGLTHGQDTLKYGVKHSNSINNNNNMV
jgi:hypothetical protein